jgi:uncharacterized DUF497 family protein
LAINLPLARERQPLSALRFEWDPHKAAINHAKHSVSFEEAMTVFGDPLGQITDDPDHQQGRSASCCSGSPIAVDSSW